MLLLTWPKYLGPRRSVPGKPRAGLLAVAAASATVARSERSVLGRTHRGRPRRAHFSTRAARCASLRQTRHVRPALARPLWEHGRAVLTSAFLMCAFRSLVRIDTAPFTDASSRGEASACPTRTRPLHCGLARPWMLYGRTFEVSYPDTRRRSGLVWAATAPMSTDANPDGSAAVYIMAMVERSPVCAVWTAVLLPNLTRVWGVLRAFSPIFPCVPRRARTRRLKWMVARSRLPAAPGRTPYACAAWHTRLTYPTRTAL